MNRILYTTQRQVRAAFWLAHPTLPRRRIQNYSGNGTMYPTDTRCAFVDYIDALAKAGQIGQALAERITLGDEPSAAKVYVQRFGQGQRETVSECNTWAQARAELTEHLLSDPSADYYLSRRCCANWREA